MRYLIWTALIAALLIAVQFGVKKPEGECLSRLEGECIKMRFPK